MTYSEAIQFLFSLRWFGAKFGLENTLKLAALAGNPQGKLRFIHVAGTNGKGSTCAMLEGIYRAAGLRVGLFTSPHLVAFGERIQVNRAPISEDEVARLVEVMRGLLEEGWTGDNTGARAENASANEHPTFFEVVTVMAMLHFAARKCDLVIWETGLGGRLDATNIVKPLASVITNIQHDHQQYLGETLARIAAEKAGIIKEGVPVITGTNAAEALAVIEETARRKNAPLRVVQASESEARPLAEIRLPLLGKHQRANAAVALAAVGVLSPQIPVTDEAIRAGLQQLHWPGRLQLITRPDGQKILLDGAHNVGGAEMLAAALREHFPSAKPALVLGILRDKDWPVMCQVLAPLASRILLVPVQSERTAEPHGLAEACRTANPAAAVTEHASLAAALSDTARDPFVAIAGSLYLIGEAMEVLRLSAATPGNERDLNEWHAKP
jgi:dihydrofolate synthase/folylpolyglutamate synthase